MIVSVCLCTYKRESLRKTLDSLVHQQLPQELSLQIVVADNDVEESGRAIAESFENVVNQVQIDYHVNPERNLAAVRNSTIEAARGELLAFIDDDEWAEPDWIAKLYDAMQKYQADAVFGCVVVLYPEQSPQWIVNADLFGKDNHATGAILTKGATSNALIKSKWTREHGIRFDPQFGKSGGEDTDFFHRMHKAGAKLVCDNRAVVSEVVESHRLNLDYLLKQNRRIGQTHWSYLWSRQSGFAFLKTGLFVLAQVVAAALLTVFNLPFGRARYARWYLLLIRNIEKLKMAVSAGGNKVELYGNH